MVQIINTHNEIGSDKQKDKKAWSAYYRHNVLVCSLTFSGRYLHLSDVCCDCGCCHGDIGLRHIAILRLVGTETLDMGGVLELYPINGKNFLL